MKTFSQYQIDQTVYIGDKFVIYHAQDIGSKKAVYLKALKAELPDLKDIARLEREYGLLSQLDAPEIIKCYGVVKEGHQIAIVMEDILDGVSLQEYCKLKACDPSEFLNIALQIVQGLIALHEKKIIHKDIKPSNILISKRDHRIKIIDFGISTQLSRENPEIANKNIMEGSLPYISPEQTGMVNTPLDYRTDFYSLGISFYEMLSQKYPFSGGNYNEWVNAHVSQSPKHLREQNPKIPEIICNIVMRLIQKVPENRYQNFSSLKKDLQECQRQLEANGDIEKFTMSTDDLTDRFQVSDKLYGRDSEVKKLLNSFASIANGDRRLLLVSGYSGIGKSTLVSEVKESVVAKKGYYATGKVDQYNQAVPYAAFVEAFKEVVKYLFQENDTVYAEIVRELKQQLYPNERMLTDFIPALRKILDAPGEAAGRESTPLSEMNLATVQDENRFKLVIKKFITVIAKKERPLVIFLDDLQWAGTPTFNLLRDIILDNEIESLLIIGAYRDNEVNASHPLSFMINDINRVRPIEKLQLSPLEKESVQQIVADTLHCDFESALPITEILYKKAEGNPFFTSELLKNLHRERYIDFNYEKGCWEWDIEKIKTVSISDNVVEFMISRLKQLSDSSRELLKKASCIGSQFDLKLLSELVQRDETSVAHELLQSLILGILTPVESGYELASFYDSQVTYRFQHDRIQQAAYEMIEPDEKPAIHLLIGKTLKNNSTALEINEKIVTITDHMNKAISLISSEADKLELAKLNLAAGIKAKASIAYQAAFEFLKIGISLLEPESWKTQYQLTYDLYEHFSQSAFLCGELSEEQSSNETLLAHARTSLEKAKIYRMRAVQHTLSGKAEEALDDCIEGLRLLGIKFKKNVSSLSVLLELIKTKSRQGFKPIAGLIDLPLMQDPEKIVAMQLLLEMAAPCYTLGNNNLFAKSLLRQVSLSIQYGTTKESPAAYAAYGLLLNVFFNQPGPAFEFGKMAVKLNEKLGDVSLRCRTLFVYYVFIYPWNLAINALHDVYPEVIKAGYQSGDLLYVTYAIDQYSVLPPKDTLEGAIELGRKYIEMVSATKYEDTLNFLKIMQQFRLSLQDRENSEHFKIDTESEVAFVQNVKLSEYDSSITGYLIKKVRDSYLFLEYQQAYSLLDECEKSLEAMLGSVIIEEYYFFAALTLARHYESAVLSEKKKILARVRGYYQKVRKWASRCEVNFLQHALLLEATLLRLKGKTKKAADIYQKAIEAAQKNNFLHDEALICEEAADFYHGIIDIANEQKYRKQAHYAYLKWGALAKVAQLEKKYPDLKAPEKPPISSSNKAKSDSLTL